MIAELDCYTRFTESCDKIIKKHDAHIKLLYRMDDDLGEILKICEMYNTPNSAIESLRAMLMCVIMNVKANRFHHIALRHRLDTIDKYLKLAHRQ